MTLREKIFELDKIKLYRNKAALSFPGNNYLLETFAEELAAIIDDTSRQFEKCLIINCYHDLLSKYIKKRTSIKDIVQADISEQYARSSNGILIDEENIDFPENSFDLVFSVFNLHRIENLHLYLTQIKKILKPNGIFLGSGFGIDTLKELRKLMFQTEIELEIGNSPHITPFADVKEYGNILQHAGFYMPVADSMKYTILYDKIKKLFSDIKEMGESNALAKASKRYLGKNFFNHLEKLYLKNYAEKGNLIATYEIITVTALKP